jgi:hypothetical protein
MRRLGVLIGTAAAMLVLAACGLRPHAPGDTPAPTHRPATPEIEMIAPVLVMNPDGSATLSAKILNHIDAEQEVRAADATSGGKTIPTRFFEPNPHSFALNRKDTIGGVKDAVRITLDAPLTVGSHVAVTLYFTGFYAVSPDISAKASVPVVARTAAYDAVAGGRPNTAIKVEGGKIVVVPGQKQAMVDGTVISTVNDTAYDLPTAQHASGAPVPYLHHTATGGPYGFIAQRGKRFRIGFSPYTLPPGQSWGDFDYFDAKDVAIGEKITVTIPFQSGNVKAVFTVVAG